MLKIILCCDYVHREKYQRIFVKFEHGQIHSLFKAVLAIAKLFLLGRGIDVTSFATMPKDGSVTTA